MAGVHRYNVLISALEDATDAQSHASSAAGTDAFIDDDPSITLLSDFKSCPSFTSRG